MVGDYLVQATKVGSTAVQFQRPVCVEIDLHGAGPWMHAVSAAFRNSPAIVSWQDIALTRESITESSPRLQSRRTR